MKKLFGTSGIRMKDLSPEIAYKIGFALSQLYDKVVIGRDTRTTGLLISNAIITGLLNGGSEAINISIVPTPVLGYTAKDYDVGVMITASHNPPEYNGIKLFNNDGTAFNNEQEIAIEKIVFDKNFKRASWDCVGDVWEYNGAIKKYGEHILNNLNINEKHNVVVDCANSAGSLVSPYLFTDVGCHVISVNSHIDGRFIGRMPEPNENNLHSTMKMIKGLNEGGGNYIGIAHDGDADRMIAIDEKGRLSDFDKLLALFSRFIVEKTGKKTIITTVDTSMILDEYLSDLNGKIIRTKVGDVAVSEKLKEYDDAVFGGEPSGTWIHKDIHMTPDGILSGLRLLEVLEYYSESLWKLLDSVPSYLNFREKIQCNDNLKDKVMEYVKNNGYNIFKKEPELIDGCRFTFEDGWILIRPSGTEPYIRIRVESKTKDFGKELLEKGKDIVNKGIKYCGF